MRSMLFDRTAKRWSLGVALVAGLATLLITLAPSLDAQSLPIPPQHFWGTDATAYPGAQIKVFNQDGNELPACAAISVCEEPGVVYPDGGWHVTVDPATAVRIKLRIVLSEGSRETGWLDVVRRDSYAVSIREFANVVQVDTLPGETLAVKIRARLHPTRPLRTLEFNISVNGVDIDPPPARRFLTPGLDTNRWYQSSPPIDAGGGYEVRVLACKRTNDDVIFGLRVEGYDDIIPPQRRLPSTITHNGWLQSRDIEIPLPGDAENVIRLGRGDIGCTASPIIP